MPFSKGQSQPSRKQRVQTKDRFVSKTSRKQACGHWQSQQGRFVHPQQARNYDKDDDHVAVDLDTGELKRLAAGGAMPKRKFRVMAKYSTEARGCYGVCCPVIDGIEKAQFIETFDYTEKKLISLKAYKILMQKEMTYHRKIKSLGWKNYNSANPYLAQYGNDWEAHLKESPALRKYK